MNLKEKKRYSDLLDGQERKSSQFLLPLKLNKNQFQGSEYKIYPFYSLGENKIFNGVESLGEWISVHPVIIIDGFVGVFWDKIQESLENYFSKAGFKVNWICTRDYLKSENEINELINPSLGETDSVWGKKTSLQLSDLYELEDLQSAPFDYSCDINIIIGPAASLVNFKAPIIYFDLPKNELQYRMRAGSILNLGATETEEAFKMYKRFYFVDWVLLNKHKKEILNEITIIADGQAIGSFNWMFSEDFRAGLANISQNVIQVRPWFEPGAWGGQWIKQNIPHLNKDVVNYAWSFALIVPENGLIFESDGYLLEVSFDFLMFHHSNEVLGKHSKKFGFEFPIRFNFLDTFDGGNLSIQCHPSLEYIQKEFGENITQDESYYILDCKDNAGVYIGFQEDIDPENFKEVLLDSQKENKNIEIEDFVQKHTSKKHDLYLIPNGTIHSAGSGNMVLEISATPYIFTFKMYDWIRLDLNGKPRPINIEHGYRNLNFQRKGFRVKEELFSKPALVEKRENYEIFHLPTHEEHFYDIRRIHFNKEVLLDTNDSCQVFMLVEGDKIKLETENGMVRTFAYAETFVIPAAANKFKLTNMGKGIAKVINAFLKDL